MTRPALYLVTESGYPPPISRSGREVGDHEGGDMEMVQAFLANQTMRGLSPATVKRREWTLTAFVDTITPRSSLAATTADVEVFISARTTAATRRALLGDLRAFYRWAASRGHTSHDPTLPVETPKVPRRLATPLSRDELTRAWSSAGFVMRCVIGLGAGAGLRVSEMAKLTTADIDLDARVLIVRGGKGGIDRAVPIAARLASLLEHAGPIDVVPYSSGESVSKAVRRHFRRCGIAKRPHDLRHTFATEAARMTGGNMIVVAQLMGHASIQTTQRYTAALPGGREVVDAMWQLDPAA